MLYDSRLKKILLRWCCGFGLSIVLIWLVGTLVLSLPDLWQFDTQLNIMIHAPGTAQIEWQEGAGRTQFNAHGAQGLETIPAGSTPQVCFFGDSYVQAGQVALGKNFYNLYNRDITNQRYAIAYGFSGRDCPVYFELMKTIPNVFSQVDTYVLFLGVDDILPNGITQKLDPPEFVYKPRPRPLHDLRKCLYEAKANFLWELLKRSKDAMDDIRFRPGPVHQRSPRSNQPVNSENKHAYDVFWKTLIDTALASAEQRRVVIAIKETVPRIEAGSIKRTITNAQILDGFIRVARECNVDVIDLRNDFLAHFDETGEFPKGFAWTYPGAGHWNQTGHRIIADSMIEYFSDNSSITGDGGKQ